MLKASGHKARSIVFWQFLFLARLDEVQEELLYYPGVGVGVGVGVVGGVGISKKFNVEVFYVMGKALSGELSCPCDRSCLFCNDYYFPFFSAESSITVRR